MAGTVTPEAKVIGGAMRTVTFSCVGDASDGSIPDYTTTGNLTSFIEGHHLTKVIITNDSAEASVSDNADVYLLDDGRTDILEGQGVDALDDDTRNVPIMISYPPIVGALTLRVTNQSIAGGVYTVKLIFER